MLDTIFVGMDVYKATISVAVGDGARGGEVRQLGNFLNRADHVDKLVQRLSKTDGRRLRFCYEAGPCGYGLHMFSIRYFLPLMGAILDEVIRPDMVRPLGAQPQARAVRQPEPAAFGLFGGDFQPLAPPDPLVPACH